MGEDVETPNLAMQGDKQGTTGEDKSDNKKDVVIIRYFPRNNNNNNAY